MALRARGAPPKGTVQMQLLWMLLTTLSTPLPALRAGWEEGWPHRCSLKMGVLGSPAWLLLTLPMLHRTSPARLR